MKDERKHKELEEKFDHLARFNRDLERKYDDLVANRWSYEKR